MPPIDASAYMDRGLNAAKYSDNRVALPLAVETDVPLLFQPEGKLGSAEPLTF